MKTKILSLLFAVVIFSISCNRQEDEGSKISADDVTVNAKIDVMNEDVSKIMDELLTSSEGFTNKQNTTSAVPAPFLPSCATVTRVPAIGTPLNPGDQVTKTIDFGATGCPLQGGNVLKGIIIMEFVYNPGATSHTVTYTLEDFYHNDIKFNGTKTFTRVMSVSATSSIVHPIVTMNMDIAATLPNGNVVTRTGTRVREIVHGYDTPLSWWDNSYQISGNWTTTFPSGAVQTSTISTPLLARMNCNFIVLGVIDITRNSNTAVLDYGNGNCNNQATLTINGVITNITLGN